MVDIDGNVNDIYEMILPKIEFSKLFGEKIDMNNPKHVAVAFYLLGKKEGKDSNQMKFLGGY